MYIYITYIFCTVYFSFSSYKRLLSVFYDDSTKFYRQHTYFRSLLYYSLILLFFLSSDTEILFVRLSILPSRVLCVLSSRDTIVLHIRQSCIQRVFHRKRKIKKTEREREDKEVRYVSDIDLIDAHAEIKNQLRVVKILRFQSLSYISYENGLFTRPESFFANGLVRPRQTRGDTVRWESRQDFCFSLFLFSFLFHLFLSLFPFSFLFSREIFKSRSTDP